MSLNLKNINRNDSREKQLVIKELLTPIEYYIVYSLVLSKTPYLLTQLANLLNMKKEDINKIYIEAIPKLEGYQNEIKYLNLLNKIKRREGNKFYRLRTSPITPIDIIKYKYLKVALTKKEQQVYRLLNLSDYIYSNNDLITMLNISYLELEEILLSIKSKIAKRFNDVEKYRQYRNSMINKYGFKIYDILKKEESKPVIKIDYQTLNNIYSNLSLDEILQLIKDNHCRLNKRELNLLKKYYHSRISESINCEEIENEINNVVPQKLSNKIPRIPIDNLYQTFLNNQDEFNDEIKDYLMSYVFKKVPVKDFKQKYPNSVYGHSSKFLIDKLEMLYYNINDYLGIPLTKNFYLEIRDNIKDKLSPFRLQILDLYYGLNGKSYLTKDIAEKLNLGLSRTANEIRIARLQALQIYSNIDFKEIINKDIYIPYITSPKYELKDRTRHILNLHIIQNLSYEELSQITGLSPTNICSIVNDGLKKIDFYRFGIIASQTYSPELVNKILQVYNSEFTDIQKEIIKDRYINKLTHENICAKYGITSKPLQGILKRFKAKCLNYQVIDVNISKEDIKIELDKHLSESILTELEKQIISYISGTPYSNNPDGIKLNIKDLSTKLNISTRKIRNIFCEVEDKIKGSKAGLLKSDYFYISRNEINELLNDKNLPIDNKEREIICYLFELKGYPYKTINELALLYDNQHDSIIRIFKTAIVKIRKYQIREKNSQFNFDKDIRPILKYFPLYQRNIITDYFKNNFTQEEISLKYNISVSTARLDILLFKIKIKNLIENDENVRKFDFDFYEKALNDPRLPFIGDLPLTKKMFDMFFGVSGKPPMSTKEIIKELNLNVGSSTILSSIYSLMLSICKLQNGITLNYRFSYEDVKNYYDKNKSTMDEYKKLIYEKYLSKELNSYAVRRNGMNIPLAILDDLVEEKRYSSFSIKKSSLKELEIILSELRNNLKPETVKVLELLINNEGYEIMSGKEKTTVYRIFNKIERQRKKDNNKRLTLNNN